MSLLFAQCQLEFDAVADCVSAFDLYLPLTHIALRKAKITYSFGLSECKMVKQNHVQLSRVLISYTLIHASSNVYTQIKMFYIYFDQR